MTELWTLFRFRQVNEWLWREMLESAFFHNAPEDFNDPFDCRVNTERALARAFQRELPSERRKTLEDFQRRFSQKPPSDFDLGVCCFTNNAEDPLMWAHYADKHRGVCLTYKIPADYFMNKYPQSETEPFFVGSEKVHYGDDAYTDWLGSGDMSQSPYEPIELAASRTLVTKAECWEHESEYRTIVSKSRWAMRFEPSFLSGVIFGLRTPEADKKKVAAIALLNNPHVELAQAKVSTDRDFALTFVDVAFVSKPD
jgi:hypothetical protein